MSIRTDQVDHSATGPAANPVQNLGSGWVSNAAGRNLDQASTGNEIFHRPLVVQQLRMSFWMRQNGPYSLLDEPRNQLLNFQVHAVRQLNQQILPSIGHGQEASLFPGLLEVGFHH